MKPEVVYQARRVVSSSVTSIPASPSTVSISWKKIQKANLFTNKMKMVNDAEANSQPHGEPGPSRPAFRPADEEEEAWVDSMVEMEQRLRGCTGGE